MQKIYITLTSLLFCFTVLHAQTEEWVFNYDKADSSDETYGITLGADGNIYATGEVRNTGTGMDFTVFSIKPTGDTNWVYSFDSVGLDELSVGVVYGNDNRIYVAGFIQLSPFNFDITVICLDTNGNRQWIYTYDRTGFGLPDIAFFTLIQGVDNNLYLTGFTSNLAFNTDFSVLSLTTAGAYRWEYHFDGGGNDEAFTMRYGPDQNLYIGGIRDSLPGMGTNVQIVSLDTAGALRWTYTYISPDTFQDEVGFYMDFDAAGNLYVPATTASGVGIGNNDFTVISLDPLGSERWVYTYGAVGSDGSQFLVIGPNDYIYASGHDEIAGNRDVAVIKLNTAGVQQWAYTRDFTGLDDEGNGLVYSAIDNRLYIAAAVNDNTAPCCTRDLGLVVLDTAGVEQWTYVYTNPDGLEDEGRFPIVTTDGKIYISGFVEDSIEDRNFTVHKLCIKPYVSFTASADTICQGGTVSFSNTTVFGNTYEWKENGVLWSTAQDTSRNFPSSGSYMITLVAANDSCIDSTSILLVVNPTPTADAGMATDTVCLGGSVWIGGAPTASGGTPGYTYSWAPAGGLSSTIVANPTATPGATTVYTVTVTDSRGCTDMDSIMIVVNPVPTADAGADDTVCVGSGMVIGGSPTASGGTPGYTYSWSPAGGLSSTTVANPTATPGATTVYTVTVTDSRGCTDMDAITVVVSPLPTADAGPDDTVCVGSGTPIGGSPTASGGTPGYTYSWSPAGGLSSTTVANPTATPGATTVYTVTVTDSRGCTDMDAMTVVVSPLPTADAGVDDTICAGGSGMTIGGSPTASGGTPGYTYSWSPAGGLSSTIVANPTANPGATTTYTVTVTDAAGCNDMDSVTVTFDPNPTADAGPDDTICDGASVIIGGSPTGSGGLGAFSYAWTPGGTLDNAAIANPTATPTVTTSYMLTLTDAAGCIDMDTMTIIVDSALSAPPKPTITKNSDTLTSSVANSYQWIKDGVPLAGDTLQSYVVTMTGTYQVVITDSSGCSNTSDTVYCIITDIYTVTDDISIEVYPNPTENQFTLDMTLRTKQDVTITLINSLGQLVWITKQKELDGRYVETYDATYLPGGLYFLKIATQDNVYVKGVVKQE